MAARTISETIIRDIRHLIAELGKENIRIDRAILFGSQVRGTATEWSDIDVALVSPDFSGSRYDDNCRIRKIKLRANKHFDTHPFTREDFDASPFAHQEILKYGVEIQ